MKLKEKINNKIDNNEVLSVMKALWTNKRYRSVFWLILYFIFFSIIIMSLRSNYSSQPVDPEPLEPSTNISLNVSEDLSKLENYNYEILLNGYRLITGEVKDSTNTFVYNNKNYVVVGDNIYMENKSILTKIDLTKNSDLIIPVDKITIDKLENYIKDLESIKYEESIQYNVSMSNIFQEETIDFNIIFYGKNKIEIIELNFNNYIELKELKYDKYVLTIKIGDDNNDNNS